MIRSLVLVMLPAMVCVILVSPTRAEDTSEKLTAGERKELEAKWLGAMIAGGHASRVGKLPDAVKAYEDGLKVARRLYNPADFPDGHSNLATTLDKLAALYEAQGQAEKAEPLFTDALALRKRMFRGDHIAVVTSMSTLALLYQAQGKADKAEPLFADALAMSKRLFKGDHADVASCLNNLAVLYQTQGKADKAESLFADALAMTKRLFPGDHPDVATSMNNLAYLHAAQGKVAKAEPLYTDALAMQRRLFKGDHHVVATSLNNLAHLYHVQGEADKAEPLFTEGLAMRKRLFKGDHPNVAASLNNLAELYVAQGKVTKAEPLYTDALAMQRRVFKGDHPDVATSLNNLAALYQTQGNVAKAEPLLADALTMTKRLFPDDHPDVAASLNNLAALNQTKGQSAKAESLYTDALNMTARLSKGDHPDVARYQNNLAHLYHVQGKADKAEQLYTGALAMRKRVFKTDHPMVANSLNNLAYLYQTQGKVNEAEQLFANALEVQKRLLVGYAAGRSEGDALNFASTQAAPRDALLSLARQRVAGDPAFEPSTSYPAVWTTKGTIARLFEQRHLRARVATDLSLSAKVSQLADLRRQRADLVLAVPIKDPFTLKQRETDLKALDDTIATLTRELASQLSASAHGDKLDAAALADLRKALPVDAAVVDYVRYTLFGWDDTKPAGQKQTYLVRYVAFVVTRDAVTWVDLDTAATIEPSIEAWRAAITSGNEIDPKVPAKVRALVWGPLRKHLPAGTKTVFVCPDAALCKLPFAALPGDQPGTVLLEDFALATVPHAPFLLDKLWPQDPRPNPPTGALVVGGVNFNAQVGGAQVADPLVKPGAKAGWGKLPNTVGELNGIGRLASEKKYAVTRLEGDKATTAAVLDALPKAKVAHFATHGFFADPSFRGVFQLDDKDFQKSQMGERIGRIANNPLLMTGLVCAGANAEGTPGRGVLTGDALIDRDLSGLELAVLSACETGLGDLGAGGEGVFGLQRAFHYAGAKNVVASLWKVPDAPTAALMSRFYTDLWEKNLPPIEALRQAQLHIYRNPGDVPELAKGFRGKFEEVKGAGDSAAKPQGGKAHPLLWAAFSLSGTGK